MAKPCSEAQRYYGRGAPWDNVIRKERVVIEKAAPLCQTCCYAKRFHCYDLHAFRLTYALNIRGLQPRAYALPFGKLNQIYKRRSPLSSCKTVGPLASLQNYLERSA